MLPIDIDEILQSVAATRGRCFVMGVFKFPHLSMGEKEEWNVLTEHLETSFHVWPRHGVLDKGL